MSFLSNFLVSIMVGYLSLTNNLADKIDSWLSPEESIEQASEDGDITTIPSLISEAIPDVLIKSAKYQAAAVAGSAGLVGANTRDPFDALVNIFCTMTSNDYVRTTTGTGFFIDPDGVIMTNAHVAQFLILEETNTIGDTECIVRSGNPAAPKYQAELLYISPAWIQQNSTTLTDEFPVGTGERDYALLYVSESVDKSPLPAVFPALGFSTKLLPLTFRNNGVLAAGYPAAPLFLDGPSADLIPKKASTTVSELYTFGSNRADVFSIRGSLVGEEGSSGGPVLNENGDVVGVIVTRGDDSIDGEGSLRAITLSHIEQTMLEETNFSLAQNLSGNLPFRAEIFADTMTPFLLTILQQAN